MWALGSAVLATVQTAVYSWPANAAAFWYEPLFHFSSLSSNSFSFFQDSGPCSKKLQHLQLQGSLDKGCSILGWVGFRLHFACNQGKEPKMEMGMTIICVIDNFDCIETRSNQQHFQWQVSIGWIVSASLAYTVIYGLDIESFYLYGDLPPWPIHVLFGGFSRFAYGIALSWLIFACVHGYGGRPIFMMILLLPIT